jgi:glutathione peroxidase
MDANMQNKESIFDIELKTLEGNTTTLAPYKGKVMLIVNVASKCGFTSQYEGLQSLYKKHQHEGLEVLGFPCNQFGSQEPGDAEEIKSFCSLTYQVEFPMFSKVDVNGENTHPLFSLLKTEKKGFLRTEAIKWNFTKFLVGRNGEVLARFSPQTKPESLEKDVLEALKQPS